MLIHKLLLLIFLTLFTSAAPFDSQPTHSQLIILEATDPQRTLSAPGNSQPVDSESAENELASDDSSCSKWYEFYGRHRWTYTEVRWCFQQGRSTTAVFQEQANPSYFWGAGWHDGKRKRLSWRTRGATGGHGFDTGEDANDGPERNRIAEIKPGLASGKEYTVMMHYYQEGPHWEADAAISELVKFKLRL